MAAAYDGMTVIDTCEAFEEYRFENMDFNWYGYDDDCIAEQDSGDCLEMI